MTTPETNSDAWLRKAMDAGGLQPLPIDDLDDLENSKEDPADEDPRKPTTVAEHLAELTKRPPADPPEPEDPSTTIRRQYEAAHTRQTANAFTDDEETR